MTKSKKLYKYLAGVTLAVASLAPLATKAEETVVPPVTDTPTLVILDEAPVDVVVTEPPVETAPSLDTVVIEQPAPEQPSLDTVVVDVTPVPVEPTAPSLETVVVEEPVVQPETTGASEVTETSTSETTPSSTDPSSSSSSTETSSSSTSTSTETSATTTESSTETKRPTTSNQTTSGRAEATMTATEAVQQGLTQVGTFSEVTRQVVVAVSEERPVQTASGYTIVSTENSNVVIANTDGTRSVVSASAVGGKVNSDGTISVKNSKGKTETLPSTGEAEVAGLATVGLGMVLLSVLGFAKRNEDF